MSSKTIHSLIHDTLKGEPHDVTRYYKNTGVFQAIARSHIFESVTLLLVIASSCWIAVDLDCSGACLPHEATIGFQITANMICLLFTIELMIRFLAFKNIRHVVNDFWCMFDLFFLIVIAAETWVVWFVIEAFGLEVSASNSRGLLVLRISRLVRILRLAKLFRHLPELLVIIRAIGIAIRASHG
jgi:hypothetical protein